MKKVFAVAFFAMVVPLAAYAHEEPKTSPTPPRCGERPCPPLACRKVCHPKYPGGSWDVSIRKCSNPPDAGCVVHARVTIPVGNCTTVCGKPDEQACVEWYNEHNELRHDWWFLGKFYGKDANK